MYGGFFIYILAFFIYIYLKVYSLFVSIPPFNYLFWAAQIDYNNFIFFYLGKSISIFFSLGSIVLTYLIAKDLYGKSVAKMSAFFLAIIPIDIFCAQQARVDTCAVFWIMLAGYYSLKIFQSGKSKYYVMSGIASGFAFGTKWMLPAFFPVVVAHILSCVHENKTDKSSLFDYRIYLSAYIAALIFIITNPYILLSFSEFITYIMELKNHAVYMNSLQTWYFPRFWRELLLIIPVVCSPFVFIAAGASLPVIWKKENKYLLVILMTFPATYFLISVSMYQAAVHNHFLPLLPYGMILSSYLIDNLWKINNTKLKLAGWFIFLATLMFSLSDLIIPQYRGILTNYRDLGEWVKIEAREQKSIILIKTLLDPTPLMEKLVDYHNNPDDLSEEMIIILNPERIIITETESILQETQKYQGALKVLKDLRNHNYPYREEKKFVLSKIWQKVAPISMPLTKGYAHVVYQRDKVYLIEEKIDFIKKAKADGQNLKRWKRICKFVDKLSEPDKFLIYQEIPELKTINNNY